MAQEPQEPMNRPVTSAETGPVESTPAQTPTPAQQAPTQPPQAEPPKEPVEVTGELVLNRVRNAKRRTHNQYGPGGWLLAYTFELFVDGYRALKAIAAPEHLVEGALKRVRIGGYKGDMRVYIWPTHHLDPDGVEIDRDKAGKMRFNMYDYLADVELFREPGLGERFDLVPADERSPHKPALMIHLSKVQGRRRISSSKKRSNG